VDASQVVDVHAHLAVPAAEALLADRPELAAERAGEQAAHSAHSLEVNRAQLGRLIPLMADPEQRLADMDAMGVGVQVVGPMPMHHYWADEGLAAEFARATNEGVAAHRAHQKDRLLGLATVPLQHVDLAIAELEYAVGTLGLAGASVSTQVAGRELAHPAHEDFWAAAEELGVPVFLHPWGCTLGPRLASNYLGNTVGQPVETTVALSHLIFAGLLDRRRGLRLLVAHGGGYLPTYIGRSDHAWSVRADARGCAAPPSTYLSRLWFDALVYTPRGLTHLVEAAGPGRVVLGTDYPFDMGVDDPVQRVMAALDVPASERSAICGGNALSLFSGVGKA
jgi:predicted TIM-barrel fold metal-dependent hydrolase